MQQQLQKGRQQTQLMEAHAQSQQAQVQKAKNISEQIKQERQRQQSILESQRLSQMSNEPSLVSEVGDAASSLASAMGSAIGSAASSLLLKPIKGTARFIKESLTPSVKSSDVFPQCTSLFSSDIFPQSQKSRRMSSSLYPQSSSYSPSFKEQCGINQSLLPSEYPSWHPSSTLQGSPYPLERGTSVASQPVIMSAQPPSKGMRSSSILTQLSSASSASAIPSQQIGSLSLLEQPSSVSPIPSQGMRSSSSSVSASAAPSQGMRSSSIESYDVIPSEETAQYLAPIPQYDQPLATSYYQQPPAFIDDPFPALESLNTLSLEY